MSLALQAIPFQPIETEPSRRAATPAAPPPREVFRLTELVAMQAAMKPNHLFLETYDGAGATRPLSFREGEEAILRLARLFHDLKLTTGDVVALVMPNLAEASLAFVAVLQAGLRPLLVPAHLSFGDMVSLMQAGDARAIVTSGAVRALALPECLAHVAAALAHVRFVMAFGSVDMPGVLSLERLLSSETEALLPSAALLQVSRQETMLIGASGGRIASRSVDCLVASALQLIAQADLQSGDVIATTMAPDDGASLACGLITSLLIGGPLMSVPADGVAAFMRTPRENRSVLVWPGSLETSLGEQGLPSSSPPQRVVLVHQAPFERERGLARQAGLAITDLWAFGEKAISVAPREDDGIARLTPPPRDGDTAYDTPCDISVTADGRLSIRGESVESEHLGADGWCDLSLRLFCDWEQDVLAIEEGGLPPDGASQQSA